VTIDAYEAFNEAREAWPGPKGSRWAAWSIWLLLSLAQRKQALKAALRKPTRLAFDAHLASHRRPVDSAAVRWASAAFHAPIAIDTDAAQSPPGNSGGYTPKIRGRGAGG
jgi:hypothetical protein